jgi:hypothetical protein
MTEHKCSIDKLDVQWQSYWPENEEQPKWRANFVCSCGREFTWEKLVELIPFKELPPA